MAIALYGDKNSDGKDWFSYKNFETNYTEAKEFISKIQVTAGGDYPESVYDGFYEACSQDFWRSGENKMIILIGDAPPLEKPLSDFTVNDVITKANENKIKMNFYPIVVIPVVYPNFDDAKPVKTFEEDILYSSAYPNPTSQFVNLTFSKVDNYYIELFNTSGNLVLSENFKGGAWKKDIGNLSNGAYIVRVRKDKKFQTQKIIIYK